jgi:hypothetical protein
MKGEAGRLKTWKAWIGLQPLDLSTVSYADRGFFEDYPGEAIFHF